jgi:hypothetical protein
MWTLIFLPKCGQQLWVRPAEGDLSSAYKENVYSATQSFQIEWGGGGGETIKLCQVFWHKIVPPEVRINGLEPPRNDRQTAQTGEVPRASSQSSLWSSPVRTAEQKAISLGLRAGCPWKDPAFTL